MSDFRNSNEELAIETKKGTPLRLSNLIRDYLRTNDSLWGITTTIIRKFIETLLTNAPTKVKRNATLSLNHSEQTAINNYRLFNIRRSTESGANAIRRTINSVDDTEDTYDDVVENMNFEN